MQHVQILRKIWSIKSIDTGNKIHLSHFNIVCLAFWHVIVRQYKFLKTIKTLTKKDLTTNAWSYLLKILLTLVWRCVYREAWFAHDYNKKPAPSGLITYVHFRGIKVTCDTNLAHLAYQHTIDQQAWYDAHSSGQTLYTGQCNLHSWMLNR